MADLVWMYHPQQGEDVPDPTDEETDGNRVSQVTRESYDGVWKKRGWLLVPDVEGQRDEVPDSVADITEWLDSAPDDNTKRARAKAALDVEQESDSPRKTVVQKAEAVLNSPPQTDVPPPSDKES